MEPLDPGLYIVATPIGHLGDLSFRALETLKHVDHIFAEDTRRTKKLLHHYELKTPLTSYHAFNEASRVQSILDLMQEEQAIALVTDAGMPCVSDPGARLVLACQQADLPFTVIPGPSAVTTALALSGFPGDNFSFLGFLPRKKGARGKMLELWITQPTSLILFESPYRLKALLEELKLLIPDRTLFIGRELTKMFEEKLWGTAHELLEQLGEKTVKGEITLVIRKN